MEVLSDLEATLLEDGQDPLTGRARVRRGLEDDQLPFLETLRDASGRVEDDRQVRLALRRQWGRQGDQDRVRPPQVVVVQRRLQAAVVDELLHSLGRHVVDEALAAIGHLDPLLLDVDEQDRVAGAAEGVRERDADVAGAEDCDRAHAGGSV